ncbi:MAG: polymer-forming cytoskeletal protein [Firmicutes bacterium]|jgi:cytoskeletal protein CcmA (bactofilin family)|nr:polymer-forming cytoskeletal protein [Bacillota bacterium]
MLGRRPQAPQNKKIDGKKIDTKKIDTIIGRDTVANGRLEIRGSIRVDGSFDGHIHADGDVAVGESGKLKATIHAENITIAGKVEGDLYASGRLEVASTGRLYGEVKAGSLCVEDGAVFIGSCEMLEDDEFPKLLPDGLSEVAASGDELRRKE